MWNYKALSMKILVAKMSFSVDLFRLGFMLNRGFEGVSS